MLPLHLNDHLDAVQLVENTEWSVMYVCRPNWFTVYKKKKYS